MDDLQALRDPLAVARLVTALFVGVALVNLAPVAGVASAARLEALYGVALADPSLAVLLRHRALLFAVVGGLLLAAAWRPSLRGAATAAGLFSMLSFTALVWASGGANAALGRVAAVDVAASLALAAGALLDARVRRRA